MNLKDFEWLGTQELWDAIGHNAQQARRTTNRVGGPGTEAGVLVWHEARWLRPDASSHSAGSSGHLPSHA